MTVFRGGEDVGLVYQGSAVRAPPQEIFHSNSGIAVLQKAWNSALDYSKNIIIIIIILENTKFFELSIYNNESSTDFCW